MNNSLYGNLMAALSFVIWGLLPIYYRFLPNASMDELLALRIIGSVPVGFILVLAMTRHMPNGLRFGKIKSHFGIRSSPVALCVFLGLPLHGR